METICLYFYESTTFTGSANIALKCRRWQGWCKYRFDRFRSLTKTSIYFTDANGDGLIDLSINGRVFFNRIDDSVVPEGVPFLDPVVHIRRIWLLKQMSKCRIYQMEFPSVINPAFDVVKVWEAHSEGRIVIDMGQIQKGVRLSIETDNNPAYGYKVGQFPTGTCRLWYSKLVDGNGLPVVPDEITHHQLVPWSQLGCVTLAASYCDSFPEDCAGCQEILIRLR